jgi:hypothetical protein
MRVPSESIRRFGLIWCPCGLLHRIEESVLNKISCLALEVYVTKRTKA